METRTENDLIGLPRCCTELPVEKSSCKLGINFLPMENETLALIAQKVPGTMEPEELNLETKL